MGVGVDTARDHQPARRIDDPGIRAGRQARADLGDGGPEDTHVGRSARVRVHHPPAADEDLARLLPRRLPGVRAGGAHSFSAGAADGGEPECGGSHGV